MLFLTILYFVKPCSLNRLLCILYENREYFKIRAAYGPETFGNVCLCPGQRYYVKNRK